MSVAKSDIDYAHELFAPLGQITSRKIMGGLTLYCDGVVFSILDQDATLYLKARGHFADEMTAAGSHQFGAETGKTGALRAIIRKITLPVAAVGPSCLP
ncbi:MAG: TfoX/Sxy family protein [Marinosulfonomonas sp.]|nr:TfoX/Sxy family protein [Marinosulfonomonas sp.]